VVYDYQLTLSAIAIRKDDFSIVNGKHVRPFSHGDINAIAHHAGIISSGLLTETANYPAP